VKVLLGTVLVDPLHAALKDGKNTLDGVGVRIAAHIFVDGMAHGFVTGKRCAYIGIQAAFIRAQMRFVINVLRNDVRNISFSGTVNMKRANLSTTLD
jgi:hypothetical protein